MDRLAEVLLPRRPVGEDHPEDAFLAAYLGLEQAPEAGQGAQGQGTRQGTLAWPDLGTAARGGDLTRSAAAEALERARRRWLKSPLFAGLRGDLAALLDSQGGVMSVTEATAALLAARGSVETDDGERLRRAGAVLRATAEAEAALAEPRFQVLPERTEGASVTLLAVSPEHARYAARLGEAADRLAGLMPPPSQQGALASLLAVERPEALPTLPTHRLLRLAVAASTRAVLSSRMEDLSAVGEMAIRTAFGRDRQCAASRSRLREADQERGYARRRPQ
jgi:hypothetical protein